MIELTIRRPGEPEHRMLLAGGVYRMGRQDDNEIVLADKEVSRRHARLLVDRDTCVLEDLGGGNGTWVGGDRVQRRVLGSGDEIEILPFLIAVRTGARPEPRKVPVVRIVEGKGKGTRVIIEGELVTIGRGSDQDVRLDDHGASRAHATLQKRRDLWVVRDLDSANGVLLNDQRVTEAPVEPGDRITIGETVLRFDIELDEVSAAYDADAMLDDEPTAIEGPAPRVATPVYAAPAQPVQPAQPAQPAQPQPQPVQSPPAPVYAAPPAPGPGSMPLLILGGLALVLASMILLGLLVLWTV